jgi:hypothetical protein
VNAVQLIIVGFSALGTITCLHKMLLGVKDLGEQS